MKRLPQTGAGAGCAAKLAPRDLAQVLSNLPSQGDNANVIVGYDTADDAGVFRLRDNVALVQTVDFFPPMTDDPELYGAVAATNALNDVYAMGGTPITALTISCYPQKDDLEVLGAIFAGGQRMMTKAGVRILGGHTIDDAGIKFGYAVTGTIDPRRVIKNVGARAGDLLVLTKPIGTGAITTAIKRGLASAETIKRCFDTMTLTGREASAAMVALDAHACTDVTGFGLLGHAYEMAKGGGVTFEVEAARVPLLPDVLDLIRQGMLTRGDKNNRAYVGDTVEIATSVPAEMQSALFDPQTAGGLLISLGESEAREFVERIESTIIGSVRAFDGKLIRVV